MPGVQQRLQEANAAQPAPAFSALALYILERAFWGELSPQQGQKLASLACDDIKAAGGEDLTDLRALADIGILAWRSSLL
jgi:hypothetical protein